MSAGQSLRRGYAYGVSPTVYSGPTTLGRHSGQTNMFSLIVLATLILVVTVIASDPVLAATAARILGTAWSDSVQIIMRAMSR